MIASPHHSITPVKMMMRAVTWLEQNVNETSPFTTIGEAPPAHFVGQRVSIQSADRPQVDEQTIQLAPKPHLIAQLTELGLSSSGFVPKNRKALLILNTGSERRIGPNRLWVSFARERAAKGDVVLRLDQAGVGDSEAHPGASENDVYSPTVLNDISSAISWLKEQRHVTNVTLIGVCSGAYHGFQAAMAKLPVDHVVSINPLLFYWHSGISLKDTSTHPGGQLEHMANAGRSLRDPKKWLQLIQGKTDMKGLMRVLAARGKRRIKLQFRTLARTMGRPVAQDLAADLQAVTQSGVSLHFVFARGDPGQIILREEAGAVGERLQRDKKISVTVIDNADHTFTAASARLRLTQALHHLLDEFSHKEMHRH